MLWCPVTNEQLAQRIQDIPGVKLPLNPDGEAFPRILVDDTQHTEDPPIMCPVLHEVIRPDMALVRRPEPYAGPIIQPETAAFWLFHRHFQPLPSPDAVNPLLVHMPAVVPEERCNPAVPISAEPFGQSGDRRCQGILVVSPGMWFALGRSMLADHTAGPAFSHTKLCDHMIDRIALTGGAQNFP